MVHRRDVWAADMAKKRRGHTGPKKLRDRESFFATLVWEYNFSAESSTTRERPDTKDRREKYLVWKCGVCVWRVGGSE